MNDYIWTAKINRVMHIRDSDMLFDITKKSDANFELPIRVTKVLPGRLLFTYRRTIYVYMKIYIYHFYYNQTCTGYGEGYEVLNKTFMKMCFTFYVNFFGQFLYIFVS